MLLVLSQATRVTFSQQADAPPSTGVALKGRVTIDGKVPAARKITITKDPELCSAHGTSIQDVRVGPNQGVADVVIEITGIKESEDSPFAWSNPEDGYVIRQKDCSFQPKVLVIPNGESVKVFNLSLIHI